MELDHSWHGNTYTPHALVMHIYVDIPATLVYRHGAVMTRTHVLVLLSFYSKNPLIPALRASNAERRWFLCCYPV